MNQPIDFADKSAVVLSALCVVHCVVTPLLTLMIPYIAIVALLEQEFIHVWLLLLITPISFYAIIQGYRHHKHRKTVMIGMIGLALLVIAATIGHDIFGHEAEIIMTLLGSFLLVVSHLKNLRLRTLNKHSQ